MIPFGEPSTALVVAPHPDDEVLGLGGTMARLADAGWRVEVVVATIGRPPAYSPEQVACVRREATTAHQRLGVAATHWLDLPAAGLGELPHSDANAALGGIVKRLSPRLLFLPFVGDIHLDHQRIFHSGMVAARPHQAEYPTTVLAYETVSETNWNAPYLTPAFVPTVYVDVTEWLARKEEAMAAFASQLRPPPHERSLSALRALATFRGATVHRGAAEAFVLVRHVA